LAFYLFFKGRQVASLLALVVYGVSTGLVDAKTIAIFIMHVHYAQGCNEVRWRPGQEERCAPMLEPEVFREAKMCCIEESTGDIVGIFQRPIVIRRPGNCVPPSLHP